MGWTRKDAAAAGGFHRTTACGTCWFRSRCTRNKPERVIARSEHQDVIGRPRARPRGAEGLEEHSRRKETVEHPFDTMKRASNQGCLLLEGMRNVNGEVGFTMLAYDMRRAVNVLGAKRLMGSVGVA